MVQTVSKQQYENTMKSIEKVSLYKLNVIINVLLYELVRLEWFSHGLSFTALFCSNFRAFLGTGGGGFR